MNNKTLIINGSPRKKGATASVIAYISQRLQGEISVIDTYSCNVLACTDCRFCWSNSRCVIDDEMQEIYKLIDEADNIIIASPIYFAELTGTLLLWASRLQYLYASKRFRKVSAISDKQRNGAVILVDGGDGNYKTALAMGKRLLRVMGATMTEDIHDSFVYYSGTDIEGKENPIKQDKTRLGIDMLVLRLNQYLKD